MELQHADSASNNHKYIARVPLKRVGHNQTWRYFYTMEEWQAYKNTQRASSESGNKVFTKEVNVNKSKQKIPSELKNKVLVKRTDVSKSQKKSLFDSVKDGIKSMSDENKQQVDSFLDKIGVSVKQEVAKVPDKLNKVVDKVKDVAAKVYDDKDNIYDVNTTNYDDKIQKIAETPEWKAIVERQDPEYVKKNADGTTKYLIDDYLAKKKMPLIDIVDDIVSNRPITVNEVDKDAIVAGVKQKIFGTISLGVLAAGVVSKALIEKTKLSQGSYNDEVNDLADTMSAGMKFMKDMGAVVDENVSVDDAKKVMSYVQNSSKVEDVKKTVDSINEGKVMEAAKIILNSDSIPDDVKENDYFKLTQTSLSNLSEEEIAMLNVLINSVLNK